MHEPSMQQGLHPEIETIAGVLLDMDDTLFLEHSYVLSGIAAVARFLAPLRGEDADAIIARISYRFLKFGRRQLFDPELGQPAVCTIEDIVQVYRAHLPQIALFDGVADCIRQLTQRYPVALVTDGAHLMQARKVEALGLKDLIHHIVYCDVLKAPKPQPQAFLAAAELLGVPAQSCVVIGDDPTADMAGAQAAGMQSIRVLTGRYNLLQDQSADWFNVTTFNDAIFALRATI